MIEDNLNNFNGDFNYSPESGVRKVLRYLWEMVKVAVISLAIILPVRYFLIQPFYVKGASMEPNFYDHEYLIIDEITYRISEPKRGDIVVFRYPKNPSQYFIKRIIGLPGEKVKIENGGVYIATGDSDWQLLEENYLAAETETELPLKGYGNVELRSDEYFLLGDNREQSMDSRIFGPVIKDAIVGRTWLRGWPFNRVTIFNVPEYNLNQ